MKTINTVVAAMALSTLSFGVFAAEPVTASQAQNMNKIGVVSADGASTLDALEAKLAEKAAAAGASGYSITSATDAPRDKCTLSCAINGIHAAFHYLKKNYISGCVMTVPTGW